MVVTNKAAWQTLQDQLRKMGSVKSACIGEPTNPPDDYTAAIIPNNGHVDETTLQTDREINRVTIRVYVAALREPVDEREFILDDIRANIVADYFGDFTLGGSVAYALPTEVTWDYGYQTVAQTLFRVLDINIPYRVDDSATFTP